MVLTSGESVNFDAVKYFGSEPKHKENYVVGLTSGSTANSDVIFSPNYNKVIKSFFLKFILFYTWSILHGPYRG